MSTLGFVLFIVGFATLVYFAQTRHQIWAWIALLMSPSLGPWFRKRWRVPLWLENRARKLTGPATWSTLGWILIVVGSCGAIITAGYALLLLARHQYDLAFDEVLALAISLLLLAGGLWLKRNRREPFTPPPTPPLGD
jgi:hypothetical protein